MYSQHTSRLLLNLVNSCLAKRDTAKLLDVATGTGRAALALASHGGFVVGIDLVHAMLVEAQRKAWSFGATRIRFGAATAVQLPFKDETFDAITCLRFFHFMPRSAWTWIIAEMLRVLKPDGILVLEFVNPFYGAVGALFRRLFSGRSPVYLWPFQLRHAFGPMEIEVLRTVGTYLPLVQMLARLSPALADRVLRLGRHAPFSHLASEKWYVVRKRGGDAITA